MPPWPRSRSRAECAISAGSGAAAQRSISRLGACIVGKAQLSRSMLAIRFRDPYRAAAASGHETPRRAIGGAAFT
jgi:hypothetical protein